MKLDRFLRDREPSWAELHELVRRAGGRPERLGPDGVRRLGTLYRGTAADLAIARRSFRGDPVVTRLEQLVVPARSLVYASETRRESVRAFFATGYWRRIAERPVPLLVAATLLFAPMVLSAVWANDDPAAVSSMVPGQFRSEGAPGDNGTDLGLSTVERAGFSVEIFVNNIQVAFLGFAGGISAGVLTVVALLYNGVVIGVITGLAIDAGNTDTFLRLVVPHGVLELSCIVVAGAAGLRMGWAMVDPGRRRRGAALVAEARTAVELALGTAAWLVLAGLVEGFLTPAGLPRAVAYGLGIGLGVVFWMLVWFRGRPAAASSPVVVATG